MLKPFSDWLLLERTLDRPFRDAAMQSYDKAKRLLMQGFYGAIQNTVKLALVRRKERGAESDRDARSLAAETTPRVGVVNQDLYASLWNTEVSVIVSGNESNGILVLPPQITSKDFNRVFPSANGRIEVEITSRSGSGAAAEYSTGRVVTPKFNYVNPTSKRPRISVYDNFALSFEQEGEFRKSLHNISQLVMSGESQKKVKAVADGWIEKFDRSLEMGKYSYVHEYIHMLDDIRYKTRLGSKDASMPGNIKAGILAQRPFTEPYFKSDAEFNAHFQASAANIEDGIKSFLIASTSNFAGMNAAMRFKGFDSLKREHKCMRVANYVEEDLYRVIHDNLTGTWMTDAPKEFGLISAGSPLYRLALGAITWYARGVSKHFLQDDRLRMKLLKRIYSLSQDLEAVIKEYKDSMALGKVPSPQKFNAARSKFKPYGSSAYARNSYALLYSGSMMGTLKVFDPRNKYEGI